MTGVEVCCECKDGIVHTIAADDASRQLRLRTRIVIDALLISTTHFTCVNDINVDKQTQTSDFGANFELFVKLHGERAEGKAQHERAEELVVTECEQCRVIVVLEALVALVLFERFVENVGDLVKDAVQLRLQVGKDLRRGHVLHVTDETEGEHRAGQEQREHAAELMLARAELSGHKSRREQRHERLLEQIRKVL